MAIKRTKSGQVIPPTLNPSQGLSLLQRQLLAGEALANLLAVPEDTFNQWDSSTYSFIIQSFGSSTINKHKFSEAGRPSYTSMRGDQANPNILRREKLTGKLAILKSCIEQLEAMVETSSSSPAIVLKNEKVFLVHGREVGVRESVARFLEKLSLPVTILHEQSNRGRTVIEKFEDHAAEVGFAVVLLTGDDKGGLSTDPSETYRLRARQNVILELGYFLAKLGRGRVCALYEQGVEIPSDYSGVLFVELDPNRRWHVELARELKAAGFTVDMNKAFE